MLEITRQSPAPVSELPPPSAAPDTPEPSTDATPDPTAATSPEIETADPRVRFDQLFGPPASPAPAPLQPLRNGPPGTADDAAKTADPRQRAQDALKTPAPAANHPYVKHVKNVQDQLKKEGLPTDARGVSVYVVGDSGDHGPMVVRTIAGPAGLAQRANVELPPRLNDARRSGLTEEAQMERTEAQLQTAIGLGTPEQLQTWAVDAIEAGYTQPAQELKALAARAPADGQAKVVNMSWGMSVDAVVAGATKAALDHKDSPMIEAANAERAKQGKAPLDLTQATGKEDLRKFIAGQVDRALKSPDAVRRLQAARNEAMQAVKDARAAGFVPIAAAGNFFEPGRTAANSTTNGNVVASIPGVLSVGAVALGKPTQAGDESMADISSTGAAISAPGENVPVGFDAAKRQLKDVTGTSFAAPYVASVVALMIKANPRITPDQVDAILRGGKVTTDVAGTNRDGIGVIDAVAAVREAKALAQSAGRSPAP